MNCRRQRLNVVDTCYVNNIEVVGNKNRLLQGSFADKQGRPPEPGKLRVGNVEGRAVSDVDSERLKWLFVQQFVDFYHLHLGRLPSSLESQFPTPCNHFTSFLG